MRTATQIKTELSDFGTSLSQLKEDERNDEQLSQNHYGDYLMIEESENNELYRVWLNHPENVRQGEPNWQIEYHGKENGYRWETVGQGNY